MQMRDLKAKLIELEKELNAWQWWYSHWYSGAWWSNEVVDSVATSSTPDKNHLAEKDEFEVKTEKLTVKLEDGDKEKLELVVQDTLDRMDNNQLTEQDVFGAKQKEKLAQAVQETPGWLDNIQQAEKNEPEVKQREETFEDQLEDGDLVQGPCADGDLNDTALAVNGGALDLTPITTLKMYSFSRTKSCGILGDTDRPTLPSGTDPFSGTRPESILDFECTACKAGQSPCATCGECFQCGICRCFGFHDLQHSALYEEILFGEVCEGDYPFD